MAKVKVHKETIFRLISEKGMSHAAFNRAVGHSGAYINSLFHRHTDGVLGVTPEKASLWASVLGVELSELMAVPAPPLPEEWVVEDEAPQVMKEPEKSEEETVIGALAMLYDLMERGFKAVLDKMDEHWG